MKKKPTKQRTFKKLTKAQARKSAVRCLLEQMSLVGHRNIKRTGNTITSYWWSPHLGKRRSLVKFTLTLNSMRMKQIEGRDAFDRQYKRRIKEID